MAAMAGCLLGRGIDQAKVETALRLEDPTLAAAHFNWLIMSAPINQAMLLGGDGMLAPADLNRYADAGVRTFFAAYGRR